MLFNAVTDIQDTNVLNVDPLAQNTEIFNSEIFAENPSNDLEGVSNKVIKINNVNNAHYYVPNSELNLLFNLDLEENNVDIPNNNLMELTDVPAVEPQFSQESTFVCDKCLEVFTSKVLLEEHGKTHDVIISKTTSTKKDISNTCSFCGRQFKKFSDLVSASDILYN